MNGWKKHNWLSLSVAGRNSLLLSVSFVGGGLLGLFYSLSSGRSDEVVDYILSYAIAVQRDEVSIRFLPVLFDTIRIPLLVFLLGRTGFGPVTIPFVFLYRGFTLCSSVCLLYLSAGIGGYLAAVFLFGFTALLWGPGMFLIGMQGMARQRASLPRDRKRHSWSLVSSVFISFGLGTLLLLFCSLFEYWVVSDLLALVVDLI